MKIQISRHSHDPARRYSGVYQQQGRMITDADWNELQAIAKARLDAALRDAIGAGVPAGRGLRISADLKIIPGVAYTGGIAAHLPGSDPIEYGAQPDFPGAPGAPAAGEILYVDAWEREVLYLEDPALQDPGLRGADTCARTQTMLQIKRAPAGAPIGDASAHPSIGDALVTLRLREALVEADVFDPCANEVAIDEPVGNFVFRVEVHDVVGSPSAPTAITFKWSSENAAEAFPNGAEPVDFKGSDWIYEFYSPTTDKQLGVHLVQAASFPARGVLADGYPSGPPDPKAFPFVRRWDGFVTIRRAGPDAAWATAALAAGKDRGSPLAAGASAIVHGHFEVVDGILHVNLQALDLQIDLNAKRFVAGDYWLATARDTDRQGTVLLQAGRPVGVLHRYLRLGSVVDAGGGKLGFRPDAAPAFPTLAGLTSTDPAQPGAAFIGADAIPGSPAGLAAGTVRSQIADLLSLLDAHLAATKGAHPASAIAADASADLAGALDVQAQLSALILKVKSLLVLFTPDGAGKIGDGPLGTGARSIAAGTVRDQLAALLAALGAHADSGDHDGRYLRRASQQSLILPDAAGNAARCFYTSERAPDLVTLTYNEIDGSGKPKSTTVTAGGALANLEARVDRDVQPDGRTVWFHLFVTNKAATKVQVNVGIYFVGPTGAVDREGKLGKDTSAEDAAKAKQDKDNKDTKDAKDKENQEKHDQEKRDQEKRDQEKRDQEKRDQEKRDQEKHDQEKRDQEKREQEKRDQEKHDQEKRDQEKRDQEKRDQEKRDREKHEKEVQEKEAKEKNTKDSKEQKEDRDKHKEGLGAKEADPDKHREISLPQRDPAVLQVHAFTPPLPTSRAFIRIAERPPIGDRILRERPPELDA
jgi:hypothetical protein